MPPDDSGSFEILDGYPKDVIAVSARGRIDRAAYEKTLTPLVEARIVAQGKIKLLYLIGEGFEGYTPGAMWDDAKLGLMHLADFVRIAVVTDVEWIRMGIRMFTPMMRADLQLFDVSELDAAKAWITENVAPSDDGPRVAAVQKVSAREDMS